MWAKALISQRKISPQMRFLNGEMDKTIFLTQNRFIIRIYNSKTEEYINVFLQRRFN